MLGTSGVSSTLASLAWKSSALGSSFSTCREREFFTDNLLVRIHFITVMIRWTGRGERPHSVEACRALQGYLAHKKHPPPRTIQ